MKFYRLIRFLSYQLSKSVIDNKEKSHKKEIEKIKTLTDQTIDSLNSKHEMELLEKEKSHSNSLKRLSDEFENKYEKLKNSYFIANSKTVETNSIANDRTIIQNFLEKEFHSVVAQLKNSNDYLMEKQSSFLQEILRIRTEQKEIIHNFEIILDEYKERLFALGKKKKRKIKEHELQNLISESQEEH